MSKYSLSAIELCIVLVILMSGLIPILTGFSAGQKNIVYSENQFLAEQYALELSNLLSIMDFQTAKKFQTILNSGNNSNKYMKSLSKLKKGFKRKIDVKMENLNDKIDGKTKKIEFAIFTIKVKIPTAKDGPDYEFRLTRLLRKEVLKSK
ncbi:hypothetical protein ACFL35_09660 [Candidatus Riflebacteria bacterium]